MSRRDQDPRYHSGPYQSYNSNTPQQFNPSSLTTQGAYQSQNAYPTYPGGPQPPQPSGPSGGYPPYADGRGTFPGPHSTPSYSQHDSTGLPATYLPHRQPSYDPSVASHPYARQDTTSGPSFPYSGTHHPYPGNPSVQVTGRADQYPGAQRTPGYTANDVQSQNWDDVGHDMGQGEGHIRPRGPPNPPSSGDPRRCRYPYCNRYVFFDRRVNEYREWCSDEHMRAAVADRVEKPCQQCRVWPRRQGYSFCSGTICKYTPYGA